MVCQSITVTACVLKLMTVAIYIDSCPFGRLPFETIQILILLYMLVEWDCQFI